MPVAPSELALWFGSAIDAAKLPASPATAPWSTGGPGGYRRAAKWLTVLLLAINAVPILFAPGRAVIITILAIVCLYIPAWMMDLSQEKGNG